MTFAAVVAAAVRRGCSAEEFIVRMELAAHGDGRGENCRPAQATIARHGAMSLKIVRRALRDLYARGAIVRVGRDSQGIDIWKVHLPAQVPEYLHGRMLLRAYQYRLKPLPRSILIVFAASADAEGRTNGHCPSMGDLTSWFQASADAVKRALKGLVGLGLICRVKRAGGAARDTAQYDVTMDAEAISWIPGAAVKSGVQKRPRVGCEKQPRGGVQKRPTTTDPSYHGPSPRTGRAERAGRRGRRA